MREDTLRALVEETARRLGPHASAQAVERAVADHIEAGMPVSGLEPAATGGLAARTASAVTSGVAATGAAVATVGLQISLHDIASPRAATVRARAYDRIRRVAAPMEAALRAVGLGASGFVLRTTPLSWLCEAVPEPDVASVARALHAATVDSGADRIEAVLCAPFDRNSHGDRAVIARLPEIASSAPALHGHVAVAKPGGQLHHQALEAIASAMVSDSSLHERLFVSIGIPELLDLCTSRRALAYVTLSLPLLDSESPEQTAARVNESRLRCQRVAAALSERSGLPVAPGAVTIDLGSDTASFHELDRFLRSECPGFGGRERSGTAALGTLSMPLAPEGIAARRTQMDALVDSTIARSYRIERIDAGRAPLYVSG